MMSQDMIVEGLFRVGDVGVLAAPPKAGKTLALEDLAVALAGSHIGEQTWLGHRCLPADGGDEQFGRVVLYLNLELPADERLARHRSALAARGLTEKDVNGHYFALDLRDQEASWDIDALWQRVSWYVASIPALEYIDLIVFDPIYMLVDGDESSNKAMAAFLSQDLAAFRDAYDCGVIFSHHFVKAWRKVGDHQDRIAGAGTLSRYPDLIATLSPKGARVEFNAITRRMDCHDVHSRMFTQDGPRFVECDTAAENTEQDDPLEATTRAAFDELATAGPVRLQDLAEKLGKHRTTVRERLIKYGYTIVKGTVHAPVGTVGG